MIHRNRGNRRDTRKKFIEKRKKIYEKNKQCGTLYEKHIDKIESNGAGYMAKHGTLLHYSIGTNGDSKKVRDRSSYSGTNNWSPRDIKQIDRMEEQLKEI